MTGHDHIAPFDQELSERRGDDQIAEFWGTETSWRRRSTSSNHDGERTSGDDTTGTIRAIRDGVSAFRPRRVALRDATGQVQRTRTHATLRSAEPSVAERRATATIGDLAAGHYDEPEFTGEIPLEPTTSPRVGLAAVDPLLVRLGMLVLVGVLLVPLALALRPDDGAAGTTVRIEAPAGSAAAGAAPATESAPSGDPGAAAANAVPGDVSATAPVSESAQASDGSATSATSTASTATTANSAAAAQPVPAASTTETSQAAEDRADDAGVGDVTQSAGDSGGIDAAAEVDAPAERIVPACPQSYVAAPGDSWYRIADAAGVSVSAVLGQNNATVDTIIFPGDDICLPSDATIPQPPATTNPATTAPETTAPPTTAAPTTTTAPAGSPGRNASVEEVKAVIRSIFPESEWETAYTIVDRESGFDPAAHNGWCCYGLFQIYWTVHRSWLDELGIDTADDLYDPLLNTRAAFRLWERAGNSWSPWSTYDG